MTPIASLHSCALRRSFRLVRRLLSIKLPALLLGLVVSVPAFATEGTDVSADDVYTDDVTVTTFDGEPLDINGDGNVDLAIAVNEGVETSRYYPGNGDGTFGDPIPLAINPSSEIVAADFNIDKFIDLVQGVRDKPSRLYLGDGAGGLGNPISILDSDRVLAVAVGDLDKDGDLDLVTGTGHPGGEPSTPDNLAPNRFYLNNTMQDPTAPVFGAGADIAADMDDTRAIALADMDGDTKLDVLAGNDETTPGSNRIYLNQSTGPQAVAFAAGFDFGPADDQTSKILVGDLNGDGLPDIVTLNYIAPGSPGINRYFLNESTAGVLQFTQADVSADAQLSSGGELADFDGDGDLDIAVANLVNGGGPSARNRLYLNQSNGTGKVSFVGSDISTDEHQSRELAAGKIDADDDIDIVVGNQPLAGDASSAPVPGRDRVYLNNGTNAPFTDAEVPFFTSTEVTEATVDVAYTYNITAEDPEDDPITITAPTRPEWLTFEDNGNGTATLTGTPAASEIGDHTVLLQVSDGTHSADQAFTITVSDTPAGNTPPEFTSTEVTAATEGEAYTYDITATDADDGATLTITAPTAPEWLTLTDNGDGTATLTGTPAAGDVGDHEVSLQVSDGTDTAVQDFTVTVEAASSGPPSPEPPPNGDDGGGGGSLGFWSLFALAAFGTAARRRRIR